MSTSPKSSFRFAVKSGFTLIELLTVIAIVGILSAIAFPLVSRSMSAAKEVKKMAVFREYGLAHSLFVADNKGNVVPVADQRVPGTTGVAFRALLLPYFGAKNQKAEFFKPVDISHPTYADYDPEVPYNNGIGMNTRIVLPVNNRVNNWRDGGPYKLISITHPQYRVLFGDSKVKEYFIDPLKLDDSLITSRHGSGTKGMFVLFDNSVVLYTKTKASMAMNDPAKVPTIQE